MVYYILFSVLAVGFILFVAEFYQQDDEQVALFTQEEAEHLALVKDCFNELEERVERPTSGAEYDSTC